MNKKEIFIKIVQEQIFDNDITNFYSDEELNKALEFFEELKISKAKNSGGMTENGKKVLSWMQENVDQMSNLFTAKEIAEGLFTSGRSISGSMRKLVSDGYVTKSGKDPIQYSLTDEGRSYSL